MIFFKLITWMVALAAHVSDASSCPLAKVGEMAIAVEDSRASRSTQPEWNAVRDAFRPEGYSIFTLGAFAWAARGHVKAGQTDLDQFPPEHQAKAIVDRFIEIPSTLPLVQAKLGEDAEFRRELEQTVAFAVRIGLISQLADRAETLSSSSSKKRREIAAMEEWLEHWSWIDRASENGNRTRSRENSLLRPQENPFEWLQRNHPKSPPLVATKAFLLAVELAVTRLVSDGPRLPEFGESLLDSKLNKRTLTLRDQRELGPLILDIYLSLAHSEPRPRGLVGSLSRKQKRELTQFAENLQKHPAMRRELERALNRLGVQWADELVREKRLVARSGWRSTQLLLTSVTFLTGIPLVDASVIPLLGFPGGLLGLAGLATLSLGEHWRAIIRIRAGRAQDAGNEPKQLSAPTARALPAVAPSPAPVASLPAQALPAERVRQVTSSYRSPIAQLPADATAREVGEAADSVAQALTIRLMKLQETSGHAALNEALGRVPADSKSCVACETLVGPLRATRAHFEQAVQDIEAIEHDLLAIEGHFDALKKVLEAIPEETRSGSQRRELGAIHAEALAIRRARLVAGEQRERLEAYLEAVASAPPLLIAASLTPNEPLDEATRGVLEQIRRGPAGEELGQ